MRRYTLIAAGLLAFACSDPCRTAQPVINEYLGARISHPETYKPIRVELVGEGRVDRDFYHADLEEPTGDSVDVLVFRQAFRHLNRYGDPTESVWCLYMTEDMNAVLCASHGEEPMEGVKWKR